MQETLFAFVALIILAIKVYNVSYIEHKIDYSIKIWD